MCGFIGYTRKKDDVEEYIPQFNKNLNKIRYRGPDYSNFRKVGSNVLLGHNRLSIIDLDPVSNQPMSSKDKKVHLVFNGEIYNYKDLKKELRDYNFVTHSDTEVIIAAYYKWGVEFIKKLNGMFSIALYDVRTHLIILARDHIGKKPLYYSYSDQYFCFGSEVKALIGLPGVGNDICEAASNQYFSTGFVSGENSIYRDIKQIKPGRYMVYNLKTFQVVKIEQYWSLTVTNGNSKISKIDLVNEFEDLLIKSVTDRMNSDVPLGVFLSGGLDSSLIAAIASNISQEKINTFTIGFSGYKNDEEEYANSVASFLGTNHTTYNISSNILKNIPSLINKLDQPFADSSFIPTYYLCKEVKGGVDVVLSGDGGDELFAGYEQYSNFSWEYRARGLLPYSIRKAVGKISKFLPERHKTRVLKRFIYDDIYQSMGAYASRFFDYSERKKLLSGSINVSNIPEKHFNSSFLENIDWLQNICQNDFKNYMVDDILVKVDRMSMQNSLEVRSPLLDKDIANFAFSKVPVKMKLNGDIKKFLLKELAKKYLPSDFPYDRKAGFGVPLSKWFDEYLTDYLQDLIKCNPSGYLNIKEVDRYIREHKLGLSNHSKKLFSILVWELWIANNA
jgi:asparagine synthase (glutamine-hydrolysing)